MTQFYQLKPPGASGEPRERLRAFDLITCVHGLHYIGDKLGLIARAASWLSEDGMFLANLALESVKVGSPSSRRRLLPELRRVGLEFDGRRRRVVRRGWADLDLARR